MSRLAALMLACSFVSVILVGAGCNDNPVGRVCFIGADAGPTQTIVASPALECQSRTCLHIGGREPDMCTGECEKDGDCDKVGESPCEQGFVCRIPTTTGAFCCTKLCVCKDLLNEAPDAGTPPVQAACDPNNPANECCNLTNRRGNPTYPLCN